MLTKELIEKCSVAYSINPRSLRVRKKLQDAIEAKLSGAEAEFDLVKSGMRFLQEGEVYGLSNDFLCKQINAVDAWDFEAIDREPFGDSGIWECFAEDLGGFYQPFILAMQYLVGSFFEPYEEITEFSQKTKEDLIRMCLASLEQDFYGQYDEEFLDEDMDTAADFVMALARAKAGDCEKALEEPCFAKFCEVSASIFSDVLTPKQVAMYLYTHLWMALEDGACCYSRTHVIRSDEIYAYQNYKEYVPEKIREEVEVALSLVTFPIVPSEVYEQGFTTFMDDERKTFVLIMYAACSNEDSDRNVTSIIHPLFQYALSWLIRELPAIRKEYGSASALPAFFVQKSLCLRPFSLIM